MVISKWKGIQKHSRRTEQSVSGDLGRTQPFVFDIPSRALDIDPCHDNKIQEGKDGFFDLQNSLRSRVNALKPVLHLHNYRSRRLRTLRKLELEDIDA